MGLQARVLIFVTTPKVVSLFWYEPELYIIRWVIYTNISCYWTPSGWHLDAETCSRWHL